MRDGISRREFVSWAGGVAAVSVVEGNPVSAAAVQLSQPLTESRTPTRTVRVVRADDQLDVTIELHDVTVRTNRIVPNGRSGYARFVFGPQHVAERHFAEKDSVSTTSAIHRVAGPSVVVVPIPRAIDFSLDALLDLAESASGVAVRARAGAPTSSQTGLEVPSGLMISPVGGTRVRANRTTRSHRGVTEVWVARLETATEGQSPSVRAVLNTTSLDLVARTPSAVQRNSIVTNSTSTVPITTRRLWLSSGGAFVDMKGAWSSGTVRNYRHRIVSGRDMFVDTTQVGYLLPFGHRASISTVAVREPVVDAGGGLTAAVRTVSVMQIDDPVVSLPRLGAPFDGRGLPFSSVTASTDENVEVRTSAVKDTANQPIDGVFDVVVDANSKRVAINYVATDRAGKKVTFSLPATFVRYDQAFGTTATSAMGRLLAVSNRPARRGRLAVELHGQPVAYATTTADVPRTATTHPTVSMQFRLDAPVGTTTSQLTKEDSPAFVPAMESAEVLNDVVASVGGSVPPAAVVRSHPRWLEFGNGRSNFDLAYLGLDEPSPAVIGAGTTVGAVAQAELMAEVFNQVAGISPDLASAGANWRPTDALGRASKILGSLTLEDLIEIVEYGVGEIGVDIPGTTIEVVGNTIIATFSYKPNLVSRPALGFIAEPGARCCIIVTATTSLDGSVDAGFTTEMRVENFTLSFPPGEVVPPLLEVHFASISALVADDGAVTVTPEITGWTLHGVIGFLVDLLENLGLSSPELNVSNVSIDLSTTVNLPNISLGVLEIKSVGIFVGLELPFSGSATGSVSLGIGSPDAPVEIELLMFGGTFYWTTELGMGGEGAELDVRIGVAVFWEVVDIDVVIASVTVVLRLSADWKVRGGEVVFVGKVSLEGVISVLGIIDVSLTLAVSLSYSSATEKMVLKGSFTWAVDTPLGGVRGDVELGRTTIDLGDGQNGGRFGRRLPAQSAGSGGSFGDLYSPQTWNTYCDAFV